MLQEPRAGTALKQKDPEESRSELGQRIRSTTDYTDSSPLRLLRRIWEGDVYRISIIYGKHFWKEK